MPRKPKPKNSLSAGERARIYEAELAEKQRRMSADRDNRVDESDADVVSVSDDRNGVTVARDESLKQQEKVKKILPKPEHATVKVDFSIPTGKIGKLHGMCNGPKSYGADITSLFREIGVPQVRFDGTDGAISSYAVDISRIFRDVNADPNKPESYDFSYTDKYVTAAYNAGARVIYRLGESRDAFDSGKNVDLPENIDLWINVCANVIKHYNDYFARGYAFGIEYFEIWSHDYANGTDQTAEFEFYRRVASTVKIIDSSIKVGGMGFDGFDDAAREFIKYCKKTHTPLDFVTFNSLDGDPVQVSYALSRANSYIKNLGLDSVELILGKWCYIDTDALNGRELKIVLDASHDGSEERRKLFELQASIKGAAYAAATMLELNSKKEVSQACFFDAQPTVSPFTSISDRFGAPQKPFYAFKAYGELYRAGEGVLCESEQISGFAHTGIYAGAAVAEDGACYIMIASYGGCGVVDLRLDSIPDNLYTAEIYILDGVKNLERGDSVPISGAKKRLVLNISEYGVMLVRLY